MEKQEKAGGSRNCLIRDIRCRCVIAFMALVVIILLLFLVNIKVGSVGMSWTEIGDIMAGKTVDGTAYHILLDIRLPRVLAAAVLGGALAVSGFLLQTFFANPIAGPYILGISSGAKLVVAAFMIYSLERGIVLGSASLILAAFSGSMISMGFVLLISGKVKNMAMLVICGVMIGYICSAVTDMAVTFADDANIVNLHNWSVGSFSGMTWENVRVMSIVAAIALALVFLMAKPIGAYQLGEVYARNVGVNILHFRICIILLSSVLSACVTAFAGPVSFVGIAVPHLVKSMLKTSRPILVIPGCFLGGAAFCMLCDWLARTIFSPSELGISSMTAVFGAPVVIWMMVKRRQK